MTNDHSASPFRLGDWWVDAAANRLRLGDHEIKVEARLMAVLCQLASRGGEVVLREDLERAVWGKTVVGYDALTRCIAGLRKVLEDDPRQPRYIETIAKRGYRLIARVERSPTSASGAPTSRRRWLVGGLLATLLASVALIGLLQRPTPLPDLMTLPSTPDDALPTVQIEPFINLDDDEQNNYLSRGITADITTALAGVGDLQVVATKSHATATTSLSHRYRLTGSIRRSADRIRVNVQLSNTRDGIYLWSQYYDRQWQDIFAVQDDITRQIVKALAVQLSDAQERRIARRYTTSLPAYDDFLRGQASYLDHTPRGNQQARALFQQAIEQDPAFARAYSAMALTYVAAQRQAWLPADNSSLETALNLARQGVMLDPDLPQTQWALAYVHLFRREYDAAGQAAGKAAMLAPSFADSYLVLAICHIHQDNAEQAVRLARRAMQLNPEYPAAYASVLGQAYFFTGQHQAALHALRAALARNGQLLTAHVFRVAALGKLHRADDASWAAEELRQVAPTFSAQHLAGLISMQDDKTVIDLRQQLRAAGL